MRISIVVLLWIVTTGHAAPPSAVLERAVKLYDKGDWLSAHIEFKKVIDKETGDDATSIGRAEFFVGKVLYHLGLYVASDDAFQKIRIAGPAHTYYLAALKWFGALAAVLPMDLMSIATYSEKDLEEPSLQVVRDELVYRRGVIAMRKNDLATAKRLFASVAKSSSISGKAQLALGLLGDVTALAAIPAGTDEGDLARLALLRHHAQKGELDKAATALANIRIGPIKARAAWELSWAQRKLAPSLAKFASAPIDLDGVEPALLHLAIATDYCAKFAPATDGLAGFRKDAAIIDKQLAWLLAEEDHADLYERVIKELSKPTAAARASPFVRDVLGGPVVQRRFAYFAELDRELSVLNNLDRAYQTTAAAADVLQALTVVRSVAVADAGKLARIHLQRLRKDLVELARLATTKLPVGGATGLVVQCP
jgi:hypothetical protein